MKYVLLVNFLFLFGKATHCREIGDSLNSKGKKYQGTVFAIPSYGFNLGKKVVPQLYDGADCTCLMAYSEIREYSEPGFAVGAEFERFLSAEKFSVSFGISYSRLKYSGKAIQTYTSLWPTPYPSVTTSLIKYWYMDNIIEFPFSGKYFLMRSNNTGLSFRLGIGPSFQLKGKNSGYRSGNETDGKISQNGIVRTGLDFTYGNKTAFLIGIDFMMQLFSMPFQRRLSAAGIKLGVVFK